VNSAFVLTTDEILVTVRQEAAGKSEALRTDSKEGMFSDEVVRE